MPEQVGKSQKTAIVGVDSLDWKQIAGNLDADGFAPLGRLFDAKACRDLASLYDQDQSFRSRIDMARYNFGRGEYKYFAYPLPEPVQTLRRTLYARLSRIANGWAERLGEAKRFPDAHDDYLASCHSAGQCRPTPLLLHYQADDYNCLHQDLYGDEVFPIQVVIQLSRPVDDFTGGELVIVEQRPRMQSCASVIALSQGEALAFAVNNRPRRGARGYHRAKLRHGVSRVLSGERQTLGIIFHDAK
jgi:hypothetical protein